MKLPDPLSQVGDRRAALRAPVGAWVSSLRQSRCPPMALPVISHQDHTHNTIKIVSGCNAVGVYT